jgi:hypothetical protein
VVLVRWWVDGQPVLPNGDPPPYCRCEDAACRETSHLRFELADGMASLGVHHGARVAAQALVCPAGWVPDDDDQIAELAYRVSEDALPPWPRLSNRAEFVMP